MRASARAAVCGLAIGLLTAAGCGNSTGQATGKVTWKGVPVEGAELTFAPVAAPEATIHGASGPDGVYHLNYLKDGGLPAGNYRVTVTAYTLRSGKPLPGGEEGSALRGDEGKVVKHTYAFERAVVAGANTHDFELNEGQKVGDDSD